MAIGRATHVQHHLYPIFSQQSDGFFYIYIAMPSGVDDHQPSRHSCPATKTEKPSRCPGIGNQEPVKQTHSVPIWLCKLVLKQEAEGVSGSSSPCAIIISLRYAEVKHTSAGVNGWRWRGQRP